MKLDYAIENIRRIRDIPDIELRPITVLVGRNSAGKSTFLRSLPLIRQSLETRSSAPILWFGDLVDFGDSSVAIGGNKEKRQAAFRFTIHDVRARRRSQYYYYSSYSFYRRPTILKIKRVSIRYVIGARDDRTVLRSIELKIPDENIEALIEFGRGNDSGGQITINGAPANFIPKPYEIRTNNRNLFSSLEFRARSADTEQMTHRQLRPPSVFADALIAAFSNSATRRLSAKTILREVRRVLLGDGFDERAVRRLMNTSTTMTFRKMYRDLLAPRESDFKTKVFAILRLARVFDVLEILEDQLTGYFLNVGYLEPVRAASERYYRKQELEVSGIAPNGSNFPMFLASLSPGEFEHFSKWVEEIFGYGVKVHSQGGHISLHLSAGERSINVTDTGYGVSQILPVLGVIWWAKFPARRSRSARRRQGLQTLAIEQPELHLHPAHQAKLADAFVAAIEQRKDSDSGRAVRLIVETHSEALIHRLGELVEAGRVSPNDVQIVIFSAKEDLGSPTDVSVSAFDDSGALTDWPFGFFNYSN